MRIAKYLARLGIGSRRDAEAMIARGEVTLNGKTLTTPVYFVTDTDQISIAGRELASTPEPTRLFRYYKPCGLLVTHKDPRSRPTVFEALPEHLPRLVSVGRLDINSEGLLLLTNNGVLARRLEHPASGLKRTYSVRVWGRVSGDRLAELANGIVVDGIAYGPIQAHLRTQTGANAWLTVSMHEGKNREVRRVLGHLGLHVNHLERTSYGPFELGLLKAGHVEEVPAREIAPFLRPL